MTGDQGRPHRRGARDTRQEQAPRRDYPIRCDSCGQEDTVPFKPKPGRKVFCRDCLDKTRQRDRGGSRGGGNRGGGRGGGGGEFVATCSHCGARDTVPFKPFPGSVVLCRACLDNPNVERVGGRILHRIICSSCGGEDKVPFKPDAGSRVLCKSCHQAEREERERAKRRFEERHPNEIHGTKVRIDVRCDRCGSEDTLPFVPKTTGPILCQHCAQQVFGEQWALRHRVGAQQEFPFTCSRCSRTDFVPFRPEPGRELLCKRCLNEHAIPHAEGAEEPEEQLQPFLYVRRKKETE